MEEAGILDSKDLDSIDNNVIDEISSALEKAKNSPVPDVKELTKNVYSDDLGGQVA